MSEHKKRKDDTWTKEELTSALKHKDERRDKREKQKYDPEAAHSSKDKRKSEHRMASSTSEKRYSSTGEERKSSRSTSDKRESGTKDRDRKLKEGDEKRERDRRKKEERREREMTEKEREERSKRRSERKYEEDKERKERKSKHEKEDRRSRKREDEELEKELRKYEREDRKQREKEERRSEKKEKRHTREDGVVEEESTLSKEARRREREEKRQTKEETQVDKDDRRREKEERRRRREEEKQLMGKTEAIQSHRSDRSMREKHRSSRTSVEEATTSSKDHRRREKEREKQRTSRSNVDQLSHQESSARNVSKSSSAVNEFAAANKDNQALEEGEYNYDDEEFEDYEDDFEDEDIETPERPIEVQAIINAMKQENERVQSARTQSSMSDRGYLSPAEDDFSPAPPIGMTSVNFVAAKRSKAGSQVAKKMMKRRNDLITLIQLDVISFDMFDLPPVTEYNFYIKNFGSQNTRQLSTQCNDDALTSDTQTETPDSLVKWTQHPQDGAIACGGSKGDRTVDHIESLLSHMREDSQRFGVFLNYASNLIESSFAEERYWSGSSKEGSILSCCDTCTKFNTNLSYLQGRQILHTVFGEGGMMAIAFGMSTHKVAARLDRKGLITVWKGSNTEQPDKILICDALPVTCCFAPKKKNLLFVGVDDGNVLVYDLSETSTMHQNKEIEKNKMSVLRSPTYMTGCQNDVHTCPIVCINLVGTFQSSNQVFSLDESARICIWFRRAGFNQQVSESELSSKGGWIVNGTTWMMTVVNIVSNLDDDMGLAPLGRVKLVKTNPIEVTSQKGLSNQGLGVRATCAVCPDASVFYVGLESGSVMSLTRDRKLKCYRSHSMGDVTSISISNFNMMLMLVSYGDGTLALFQVKQETPVMTWSLGNSVLFSDWSNCRSSVFFALDSTNHLHVWDLMALDSGPVVSDLFQNKTLRFCVDGYAKKNTDLMVAYDSCAFEVHRISPHFTDSVTSDEADHMVSLLLSFG